MVEEIDRLRKANESLGGVFEVRAFGLVPGLGAHTSWAERLDGRLAGALVSIQAVKGVSVGEAWEVAGRPGEAMRERTDSTVVPAAAVVGEAMVALVLARCYREKFGGDHIDDVLAALRAYRERIDWRR